MLCIIYIILVQRFFFKLVVGEKQTSSSTYDKNKGSDNQHYLELLKLIKFYDVSLSLRSFSGIKKIKNFAYN